MQYGITIDLKRCIGCDACTIACKQTNGTPPGVFFCHVSHREEGVYPTAKAIHTPMLCMHCAVPLCVKNCPTGASTKRNDGIVYINQIRCIGCKYCIAACPYNVRTFLVEKPQSYFTGHDNTPKEKTDYQKYTAGKVVKCDLCMPKIDAGELPACVQTCPADARVFGDLHDPHSKISQVLAEQKPKPLNAEYGTGPSVYYRR